MGFLRLRIVSADLSATLSAIAALGIETYEVIQEDALTASLKVRRKDYQRLHSFLHKRADGVKMICKEGAYWRIRGLLKRPVLLAGMIVLMFLTMFLPTRVLFLRVEGNHSVSSKRIIEQAQNCGISFGSTRRKVRSEKAKNALLSAIPELQWVGVNTQGCVATIHVRERSITETEKPDHGVGSVVAARDGIITELTVLKGNPLCKLGQAVKAGEVLISGYTDLGLTIQATKAEGEVFARTNRALAAVTPAKWMVRDEIIRTEKKYSLLIGKNQINFSKDSGISPGTCVKMYTEYYVLLPGGFQIPVALIEEVRTYYELDAKSISGDTAGGILAAFTRAYLLDRMVAGKILSEQMELERTENNTCLYAQFSCLEMIGRVQSEEIIKGHGKTD